MPEIVNGAGKCFFCCCLFWLDGIIFCLFVGGFVLLFVFACVWIFVISTCTFPFVVASSALSSMLLLAFLTAIRSWSELRPWST